MKMVKLADELDKLLAKDDESYALILARKGDMEQFINGFEIFLRRFSDELRDIQEVTIMPFDEHAEEYANSARLILYGFAKNPRTIRLYSEGTDLKMDECDLKRSKMLGYTIFIDKSFDEDHLGIAKRFYAAKKDELGIQKGIYMSASPVQYTSINGRLEPELPFEQKN